MKKEAITYRQIKLKADTFDGKFTTSADLSAGHVCRHWRIFALRISRHISKVSGIRSGMIHKGSNLPLFLKLLTRFDGPSELIQLVRCGDFEMARALLKLTREIN
jgi:hypothetical protein